MIVNDAVERYKQLCEGNCKGTFVNRIQEIHGVEFTYQPPPRSVVPFAAALRTSASRSNLEEGQQGSSRRSATGEDLSGDASSMLSRSSSGHATPLHTDSKDGEAQAQP